MDFPPIPDYLGDFGDCNAVGTASFSFDDFDVEGGEAVFKQTGAWTSSTARVTKAAETIGEASSHPP